MKKILFASLILLAGGAAAQSLSEQMQQCAAIERDDQRLACYDKLGKSLERRAEQDFGREQQRIAEEAPETITAGIASVQSGAYDKLIITLDNGQVWRQTDSANVPWDQGESVVVERALFGSFFMKSAEGGRKIRVKRVK